MYIKPNVLILVVRYTEDVTFVNIGRNYKGHWSEIAMGAGQVSHLCGMLIKYQK